MRSILENNKMLAIQTRDGQWWKVVKDCVQCGLCCHDRFGCADQEDGKCIHVELKEDGLWYCKKGMEKPLACCLNHPEARDEYCKVQLAKASHTDIWALIT